MLNTELLRSTNGKHYKVRTLRDPLIQGSVQAEMFMSDSNAQSFIQSLQVGSSYWKRVLQSLNVQPTVNGSDASVLDQAAILISQGKIEIFEVKVHDITESPPENRVIKKTGVIYRFAPATEQIINPHMQSVTFTDTSSASAYLENIDADADQLSTIAKELGITIPVTAGANAAEISDAIANALAKGDVIIIEDKTSTAPPGKQAEETQNPVGNVDAKAVAAGVAASAVVTEETQAKEDKKEDKKEDIPPCTVEKFKIQCKHGSRIVIADKKTREVPSLDVIATETKKSGFDTITAEFITGELCGNHEGSAFKVSPEHTLKSKTASKVEVNVCCEAWSMNNIFERIWLPTVSPKTYTIGTYDTCGNISVTQMEIRVYPDITWHWETTINFGKLEFIPGKSKVKYSDFEIGKDSNVILTYNGKEHDAKQKYKKYIQEPLDGFKKICDTVAKVLEVINDPKAALMRLGTEAKNPEPETGDNKDGNDSRLIVTWPNLTIEYDSTFIENENFTYVDHKYEISLKADPLLDIDIKVDVVDALISLAPGPTKALLRFARKQIEKEIGEDQKVGLRGELDIIFTVKATIDIKQGKLEGRHNVIEHDVTSEPVKGDIKIPAALDGRVRAEGKLFIISFDVKYGLKGETEWSGDYEFGNDETGIYFSNTVEFKGIDVTYTKYEEVKAEVESEADMTDDMFEADGEIQIEEDNASVSLKLEDGTLNGEASLKSEEEKRWSFLKPNEDQEKKAPKKHYLVKK